MSFVALMVAESSGGFDEMKDFKSWRDLKLESMVLTWGMKAAIFSSFWNLMDVLLAWVHSNQRAWRAP